MIRNPIMYNASGCYDPTAGVAISRAIDAENRKAALGDRSVYICTSRPLESKADIRYLEHCCGFALGQGVLPVSPFLFYSGICDITNEKIRRRIINATRGWLKTVSEIWVFDGEPDTLFLPDYADAVSAGKIIRHFSMDRNSEFVHTRATKRGKPVEVEEDWYAR